MKKLLDKPFKAFTIFALIVLIFSIPVYYLVVDYIWLSGLDDHNEVVKTNVQKSFDKTGGDSALIFQTLKMWELHEPGIQISTSESNSGNDKKFNQFRSHLDENGKPDEDRFRCLSTQIYINQQPYGLIVETSIEEADETLLAIALVTALFFMILIVGFIFLNRRISQKSWLPFRSTLNRLKTFELQTQEPIEFETTDIGEFHELNLVLSRLIERNISTFSQQKTFIENASHELQTPLAVLKSKIDTLLQNENLTASQTETIDSIHFQLSKVSRVNRNLLLLAKIENQQFRENESADAAEIIHESLETLTGFIDSKEVTVSIEIPGPLKVNCNKTLLEILINNLLMNAIVHNTEVGKLSIKSGQDTITISNSGIISLQKESIFQRFSITSDRTTNSGLGLAIVKEICDRYGWTISYSFEKNLHSFSVKF